MKKIKFLGLALLATMCALFMVSCDDDDDAIIQENEIPNGTQVINFSVQVIPSSLNAEGRAAGLADVKVTVSQNGTTLTKTTNATGIVTFADLRQGPVSLFIQGPEGFLSVNSTYYLECYDCEYDNNDSEQVEYNQATYELPRLGATVRGRIFADVDFDGVTEDNEFFPAGTTVLGRINTTFEPNVFKTTLGSDGTFSFTNLPENVEVYFNVDFKKVNTDPDPSVEQTFYLYGYYATPDVNIPYSFGNIYADY